MPIQLLATDIIDPEIEAHYAFIPFAEQISTRLHTHDFYEIFLIVEGSIEHHINGEVQLLHNRQIVFIRPDDAHCFNKHAGENCELINIAFLRKTFNNLCNFLEIDSTDWINSSVPPSLILPVAEKNYLTTQFKKWGRSLFRDKKQSRAMWRGILAHILSHYFSGGAENLEDDMPVWLQILCQQVQQRQYIVEGRDALIRLSNRSPEYIGRVFKTYLGITPSQFINNLRLDYAGDLLLNTDRSPTDIAYEVGFGNLSHFYHLFKARWHCSPNQFRRMNRRTLLP